MALAAIRKTAEVSDRYRWYVVGALSVAYACNVMDRSLMSILQEPIKRELGLSDTMLGTLNGLAFAIFYGTLTLPIGRFADRNNRVAVLCGSLLIWCLATAACGLAGGFLSLLIFRMLVGFGEAGGHPPSAAVISDYFPPAKRATAISTYGLGVPVGSMLGILAAGWLNEAIGWRATFFVIGLGGALVAPLIWFTVVEPKRGAAEASGAASSEEHPPFGTTLRSIWRLKSLRYLLAANMVHGFTQYAYTSWVPPFYMRSFGFESGDVASRLSLLGLCGVAGTYLGGVLADRLGRRDIRWQVWIIAIASLLTVPLAIGQFLAPTAGMSLLFAIGPYFLLTLYVGPVIGASQTLVRPEIRAVTAGVMLMTFNLFGLGLGPFITGMLSDWFAPQFGIHSLRHALVIVVLVELVTALLYVISARSLRADLDRDRSLDFDPA
jgi:predicted MFS family arabinose efflux permease